MQPPQRPLRKRVEEPQVVNYCEEILSSGQQGSCKYKLTAVTAQAKPNLCKETETGNKILLQAMEIVAIVS